jgi:hypothetical protein
MATKVEIDLAIGPNPPWTNLYFDCACGARYQLTAADECELIDPKPPALYKTPPCWSCERVTVITR